MQFSPSQLKTLSDIARDTGQVVLGATVVPIVFGIDKTYPTVLLSGIVLTLVCWTASLVIAKGVKND